MNDALPVGGGYLRGFIEKALLPSLKKESSTMFFLPGTGRTSMLRYLSRCMGKVKSELGIELDGLVFLTVDSSDEKRVLTDWRTMLSEQGVQVDGFETTDDVLRRVLEGGKRVTLSAVLGEGGPTVSTLARYRSLAAPMINFNFCLPFERTKDDVSKNLGELGQAALQNWWFLPLYDEESSRVVVTNWEKEGLGKLSEEEIGKVLIASGGHPGIMRFFLRGKVEVSNEAWQDPGLKLLFDGFWESLGDQSRLWLLNFVGGKQEGDPTEFLLGTGMVRHISDDFVIFSPVFGSYLEGLRKVAVPQVTEINGKLTVGSRPIDQFLSDQEAAVLGLLWQKRGEPVSREEISEAIWGKSAEEKYSDWAINQLVRRLRVKIGDVGEERRLIETRREKGFCLRAD